MKLFYSATSPFVRTCLVAAHELALRDRLELVPATPHPVNRDRSITAFNPLGKVPTLITDAGLVLYDSRVICEYFDSVPAEASGAPAARSSLLPLGAARWPVLTLQALADGVMDAALLCRYETATRPESLRWNEWVDGQLDKVNCGLDEMERLAPFSERVDLGTIGAGCALGYLGFRFADLPWQDRRPRLAQWFDGFGARASMLATRPPV